MPPDPSFEQQLVAHRDYLSRFALLQLRNVAWAEDAVSETIVAAPANPQSFANRSQLKTWLVGSLKNKVMDVFRRNARTVALEVDSDSDGRGDLGSLAFKADGHFESMPSSWGNPEQKMSSRQFMQMLEACTDKMPVARGRVFLMREWLDLSSEEICAELSLTAANLYVTLHRARLRCANAWT